MTQQELTSYTRWLLGSMAGLSWRVSEFASSFFSSPPRRAGRWIDSGQCKCFHWTSSWELSLSQWEVLAHSRFESICLSQILCGGELPLFSKTCMRGEWGVGFGEGSPMELCPAQLKMPLSYPTAGSACTFRSIRERFILA